MQTRRTFFAGSAGAALALASANQAVGANDKIRLGVIGTGERGTWVMQAFMHHPEVSVAAVCDVFEDNLSQAAQKAGSGVDKCKDYRQILDRKDIDVVLVATPDHWHSPIMVAACEAGKDVYVEKPISNTLEAARKMPEAAARYKRIVQVGLQQRSWPHFQEAAKIVQDGTLGKITHAAVMFTGTYTQPVESPVAPPSGLDWDMFQGPAPRHAYTPKRQEVWRAYYDYGGGIITDWGVHLIDIVHWYMKDDQPRTASASAQYVMVPCPDRDEVPDSFSLTWTYDTYVLSYSNWAVPNPEITPDGTYFFGENGMLMVNRSGYYMKPIVHRRGKGTAPTAAFEAKTFKYQRDRSLFDPETTAHVGNFLECVKSRQKPAAEINIGFQSTLPTLLAIESIKTGRTLA